ncbi:hypothetical protein [Desulfitobacterium hafniense]|uniref:hypothetical protein n=1 Tax=Desulfitobacterium hafniense TaxID=49338 RepID=UPI00035E692A|nr:hypothetical protein [Desulfitobacterium hafniense]
MLLPLLSPTLPPQAASVKTEKAAQAKPSALSQTSHKILHISKALHAQPKKTTQGF